MVPDDLSSASWLQFDSLQVNNLALFIHCEMDGQRLAENKVDSQAKVLQTKLGLADEPRIGRQLAMNLLHRLKHGRQLAVVGASTYFSEFLPNPVRGADAPGHGSLIA
jgi:hypothetical protein